MIRQLVWPVILVLIPIDSYAQRLAANTSKANVNEDVQELSTMTNRLPAEFAADILLELVKADLVRAAVATDSLVRSFALAGQSQQAFGLRLADLDVARRVGGRTLERFDRLSLQSRVVRALLTREPWRAQNLFSTIQLPVATKQACDDEYAPTYDFFHKVMMQVEESIPDGGGKLHFMVRNIAQLKSDAQVESFIRAYTATPKLQRAELPTIVRSLTAAFSDLPSTGPTALGVITQRLTTLAQFCVLTSGEDRDRLINVIRLWVLRRASDGIYLQLDRRRNGLGGPTLVANEFNQRLAVLSVKQPLINASELPAPEQCVKPTRAYDKATHQFQRVDRILGVSSLDADVDGRWQEEAEKYLVGLVTWKGPPDDRGVFYLEKAAFLQRLLGFVVQRADSQKSAGTVSLLAFRTRVERAVVDSFSSAEARTLYRQDRRLWFAPVAALLGSSSYGGGVDELLSSNANDILRGYGKLAHLLDRAGKVYY